MRYVTILVLFLLSVVAVIFLSQNTENISKVKEGIKTSIQNPKKNEDVPLFTIISQNLDTPWAIAFLPNGSFLLTERPGRVQHIDGNGNISLVANLNNVKEIGEGGLLGIVLHPNFSSNHYVYLYYTYSGDNDITLNRVVKMVYQEEKLSDEKIIVDNIPGAPNHNGGRIKFGPDGYLYITTGDAQNPSKAQDKNSLSGKILRATSEGKPAPGNPFGNLVYSFGHRNPQGITWDDSGQLFETEHGPSGGSLGTGNDEINKIEAGKNYGWPIIQGDQTKDGMEIPIKNSTPNITWAPSGTAFNGNSLFFGGLRGTALYEAIVVANQITDLREHFKGEYGRIREVIQGPDGMLYISTSNKDGRGDPNDTDDKIIKVNPQKL